MKYNSFLIKKCLWTAISLPLMYKTIWAYNWQLDRKAWKEKLIAERVSKLNKETELTSVESLGEAVKKL